jgi:hypothetical protein
MRLCILIALAVGLSACAADGSFCAGTVDVATKPATGAYLVQNDRPHAEGVAVNNRYRRAHCR